MLRSVISARAKEERWKRQPNQKTSRGTTEIAGGNPASTMPPGAAGRSHWPTPSAGLRGGIGTGEGAISDEFHAPTLSAPSCARSPGSTERTAPFKDLGSLARPCTHKADRRKQRRTGNDKRAANCWRSTGSTAEFAHRSTDHFR